ncbi:MAG TPA: alpha-N-arabinofuranosidase, partial [Spirochaetia bacterium]|nr:alpha-N-arabinofuranosidase [Spirochaetia bacterium]
MNRKCLNRYIAVCVLLFSALWGTACRSDHTAVAGDVPRLKEPLVTHLFTADPSAHVFEGKLYIYPSHDPGTVGRQSLTGDQYDMRDYHVFSLESLDSPVIDHGRVLALPDVPWASRQFWAPDAAFRAGKYYLVFPARDKDDIFRIGVAVGSRPEGPFTPLPTPIPGSFSIDPALFIDNDGEAYLYFGGIWGGQLEKWRTGAFNQDDDGPFLGEPALGPRVARMADDLLSFAGPVREVVILDQDGNPLVAGDHERRFFEAAWMHKYRGLYYLSYSTGDTHFIVYAIGNN